MIEVDLDFLTSLTHNKILKMGGESIHFNQIDDYWMFSFRMQNHRWCLKFNSKKWLVRVRNEHTQNDICYHKGIPLAIGRFQYGYYTLRPDRRDVDFKTLTEFSKHKSIKTKYQ